MRATASEYQVDEEEGEEDAVANSSLILSIRATCGGGLHDLAIAAAVPPAGV